MFCFNWVGFVMPSPAAVPRAAPETETGEDPGIGPSPAKKYGGGWWYHYYNICSKPGLLRPIWSWPQVAAAGSQVQPPWTTRQ